MLPSLKNCPDCGSSLGKTAFKCRCGWKSQASAEPVRRVECAHMGCPNGAVARVGNANLCPMHYASHWTVDNINAHYQVKPSNPHMEEVRKAYLKSYAYRHRDDYAVVHAPKEREAA